MMNSLLRTIALLSCISCLALSSACSFLVAKSECSSDGDCAKLETTGLKLFCDKTANICIQKSCSADKVKGNLECSALSRDQFCAAVGSESVCQSKSCTTTLDCADAGLDYACVQQKCQRMCQLSEQTLNQPENAWKIGVVFRFSQNGEPDKEAPFRKKAIELALKSMGSAVSDQPLSVMYCDSNGDNAYAQNAGLYLANWGATSIITGNSTNTVDIAKVVSKKAVVMSNSATAVSGFLGGALAGDAIWSTAPRDDIQVKVIAQYVKPESGNKILHVYETGPYGESLSWLISSLYKAPDELSFFDAKGTTPETIASAFTTKLEAFNPTVIVFSSSVDFNVNMLSALKAYQLKNTSLKILFTDNTKLSTLNEKAKIKDPALLSVVNGATFITPSFDTTTDSYLTFKREYGDTVDEDLKISAYMPHAYDAMKLLALAYAHVLSLGTPPSVEDVKNGLKALSDMSETKYEITNGSPGFNEAVVALKSSPTKTINITGVSGLLNYDNKTGSLLNGRYKICVGSFNDTDLTEEKCTLIDPTLL